MIMAEKYAAPNPKFWLDFTMILSELDRSATGLLDKTFGFHQRAMSIFTRTEVLRTWRSLGLVACFQFTDICPDEFWTSFRRFFKLSRSSLVCPKNVLEYCSTLNLVQVFAKNVPDVLFSQKTSRCSWKVEIVFSLVKHYWCTFCRGLDLILIKPKISGRL